MTDATDMHALYIAAEQAVLEGKTVSISGQSLGMEDLDKIRAGRKEWAQKVSAEAMRGKSTPTIGGRTFSKARLD